MDEVFNHDGELIYVAEADPAVSLDDAHVKGDESWRPVMQWSEVDAGRPVRARPVPAITQPLEGHEVGEINAHRATIHQLDKTIKDFRRHLKWEAIFFGIMFVNFLYSWIMRSNWPDAIGAVGALLVTALTVQARRKL